MIAWLPWSAYGQKTADSSWVRRAERQQQARTDKLLFQHLHVFNGAEYMDYPNYYSGHPFFGDEDYGENGLIHYEGQTYRGIPMYYDLVKDAIILEHTSQKGFTSKVLINQDQTAYFELFGQRFVRLYPDSTVDIRPGFYRVLYEGKLAAYAKYKKVSHEETSSGRLTGEFIPKNKYYIVKDNVFYPIKNKSSLTKLFKEDRKALNQFLTRQGIIFSLNIENALTQSVQFLDQHTTQR